MNRSNLVRLVVVAALGWPAAHPWAQQALEIIPLRHRTVDQVLPALQPLVEPGGTLSGSRNQLFLRASPDNVADIKRALEVIDRPAKRLQISVRLDDALERERRAIEGSGVISNRGGRITVTAEDSRAGATERVDQRVQVLEGGRAFIFTGQSLPDRDLASGFELVPRLSGSQVSLEILQQREMAGPQRGSVQGQRIATTVTTRLGEWVEIGAAASSATRGDRGIASTGSARSSESRRVWAKVEELP
jgi:hypothetical protein